MTIPKEKKFDQVEGKVGAGSLSFEEIHCDKMELDVGAGESKRMIFQRMR